MHPLAPGTQVGAWRVEAWRGQGAFGAVYRAVSVDPKNPGAVALKLSLYPWDARFAREAELLSRVHHPSIPRLLDRGVLCPPAGGEYPFFVMEWVEGTPLYTWAKRHAPSSQQVCQVLAQLARALEAVHTAGAVHRDVKGDNLLVRLSDGRPFLIDFGSGHFQGAPRLTWQSLAPFTPEYLSAQACLFDLRLVRNRDSYYEPAPADDVYALGVTAYRLVMGQYPPPFEVREGKHGAWQVTSPDLRPQLESNPQVVPGLRELLLRLLSDAPEVRGTAAQAAAALEAVAAEPLRQRSAEPQPAAKVPPPLVRPKRDRPPSRVRTRRPWLALAAAAACAVLLWHSQPVPVPPGHVAASPPRASASHVPDAGPSAVGDTSPTGPEVTPPPATEKKPVAQEPLPEPRPGQLRPDGKGRCLGRRQVAINGGCWLESPTLTPEECTAGGYVLLKGKCFGPALELPKKPSPTSSPAQAR